VTKQANDPEMIKTMIISDIRKILQGEELQRLNNSIELYKLQKAESSEEIRQIMDHNFEIRLKVN
jgi:hypothetical protein